MGLGLFAWLAVIARVRVAGLAAFLGGGLGARWCWGRWPTAGAMAPGSFRPAAISTSILCRAWRPHQFGREPVFAYLYLLPAQIFFAITLVLMAALVAMWLRNPRHAFDLGDLALCAGAYGDRAQGSALSVSAGDPGHGFSGAGLFAAPAALARDLRPPLELAQFLGGESRHRAFPLLGMAYFALYPFGVRPHMPMARYLYRHWPGTVYSFARPFQSYPMYPARRLSLGTAAGSSTAGSAAGSRARSI